MSIEYSVEELPLGTAGSVRLASDAARRHVPRHLGRRALRRRPRRAHRLPPREGRRGHDRPQVGRQPARVRHRRHRRGGPGRALPREAVVGPGLLGHDQHRHLRARAGGAEPRPDRPAVRLLEGALPAPARDGPADLRLRARRLLAGHRQPRPVPAGELRRARRARAARTSPASACAGTSGSARASRSTTSSRSRARRTSATTAGSRATPPSARTRCSAASVTLRERARTTRAVIDAATHIGRSSLVEGAIMGRSCDVRDARADPRGRRDRRRGHDRLRSRRSCRSVRVYPYKEVETGSQVNENLIWESRASTRLFGKDGVTGLVNVDLTPETRRPAGGVARHGAQARRARRREPRLGDACRMIKRAMISGLNATGVDVADLRVSPPAVGRHVLKTQAFEAARPRRRRATPTRRRSSSASSSRPGILLTSALQKEIEKNFSRQELRRVAAGGVGSVSYPARVRESYAHDLARLARTSSRSASAGSGSSSTTATRRPRSCCRSCVGPLGVEAVSSHGFFAERRAEARTRSRSRSARRRSS